jgi:hypothetical protein
MQNDDSKKIVGRFFEAIHALIDAKTIRGKQTFTRRYEINRWNFNTLEANPSRDIFQPAWLTYLVRDYGISATWLLTGVGGMYAVVPKKKAARSVGEEGATREVAK